MSILVRTLDEQEKEWTIPERITKGNRRKTSKYHAQAKQLLREMYPTVRFYEEVPVPINSEKELYLDFYIPSLEMAIEVHGEQHYYHCVRFHKTKLEFLRAQYNDKLKAEWCELNNIKLIILPYSEKQQWQSLLTRK